ncbi:DEAD/DEAH box helicase [Rubrivivax sp. JA1026]|uniref:DEAD/DEAH box helicase n=1 Tax=Rubrivivax sp. JA1026 TaxID=2710888 RepID=UPI00197D72D0|nr:NERD domain-containing protein/DEAD/DEAH box helicase [Rubrivivax sp. JA1026]
MATVIPALSTCVSRMTPGERRTAERLEQKLDDDYRVWYDVPVGPKNAHPDFVVLHPRRGVLILEVKDWRLETIRAASKQSWEILAQGVPKHVPNPLEQARHYAHQVVDALSADRQLTGTDGKLAFPWGYGVVLTHITRRQFEAAELDRAIEPHRVICGDEMTATVDAEQFQQRLWGMFPYAMRGALSLPQLDRVRWILFPEVRVQVQAGLFDDSAEAETLPDIMQVMDLQQEQLARSLGEGHRVIHGVAGSGKTMILSYRAEYLARAGASAKPVLVLCYNQPLAVRLQAVMAAKGLGDKVQVRNFHKWCRDQLVCYGQPLPAQGPCMFDEMVNGVIRGVDRRQIPSGQYQAVLIDEGHDFEAAWLKLAVQMVDPETNSLLLLYDDAQSIYQRRRAQQFSFRSVGIQAQGRTTILKINYRNTRQILQTASMVAADLLTAADSGDDGVPLVHPVSCGRDGQAPLVVRLPSLRDEAYAIADRLRAAHQEGHAWGDMAVICRHYDEMALCADVLRQRQYPHQVRKGAGTFDPRADTIKVLTMHVSKGLEFPVVALCGVGRMPADGLDEADEARLFYVAATRATQRLFIPLSGNGRFASRLPVMHDPAV